MSPMASTKLFHVFRWRGEDPAPRRGQAVEAAAPLASLFDPSPLQPSALFQAIEQGIERGDVELELSVRALLDQLADFVAVPGPRFEDRQDDELGGSLLQLAIEDAFIRWHSHICYRHVTVRASRDGPPEGGHHAAEAIVGDLELCLRPAARLLRRLVERLQQDVRGDLGAIGLRLLLRLRLTQQLVEM